MSRLTLAKSPPVGVRPGEMATSPYPALIIPFWHDLSTTPAASHGLNLPSALTRFGTNGAATFRFSQNDAYFGMEFRWASLHIGLMPLQNNTLQITTSIRATNNTANIVESSPFSAPTANVVTSAVSAPTAIDRVSAPWFYTAPRPFLAVYTSGGNGTTDFVFKYIYLFLYA